MNTPLEKALENVRLEDHSQGIFAKVMLDISNGCINEVRATIEKSEAAVIFEADKNGFSLLHAAVKANQIEIALLLLERGAEVDAKTNGGTTPLHVAVDFNNVEMISILAKHGANIDAQSKLGRTPLFVAVIKDQPSVAKMLIDLGANLNLRNGGERETALHRAIRYNELHMSEMLIKSGADVQVQDRFGFTSLGTIMRYKRSRILEMVIFNGIDINDPTPSGNLLINEIIERSYFQLIKIIIRDKSTLLPKNNQGDTPIEFALKIYSEKAAKQIMFRNFDI